MNLFKRYRRGWSVGRSSIADADRCTDGSAESCGSPRGVIHVNNLSRYAIAAITLLFGFGEVRAQEPGRITNIGHGYYAGPLYVAIREKLFEKQGLKPDVTFVKGGALVLQSVLSKDADFG